MKTKTLDLRYEMKIAYKGIIRTVLGVRPDDDWKFGPGKQRYEVLLKYLPGYASRALGTVDSEWDVIEGEDGALAPFATPRPATRVFDPEGDFADEQAERHYVARQGGLV